MSHLLRPTELVLSIDAGPSVPGGGALSDQREQAAEALLAALDRHHVAATWAIADPAASPLAERLCAEGSRHEVALFAQGPWAQPHASRAAFVTSLTGELARARHAGHAISTLVLPAAPATDRWELLVRREIQAVRSALGAAAARGELPRGTWSRWLTAAAVRRATAPVQRTLRWGLVELGFTLALPQHGAREIGRQLESSLGRGGVLHVGIDLAQTATHGASLLVEAESLVRWIARRRGEGTLRDLTCASLLRQQLRQRTATATQSVLRERAA